jgi:TolB-like protein/Tfp pilus assembly protein PilF
VLLAFGDYRLDIERRELRRSNEIVSLDPKAFDLLACLVRHRDRVVSKDDLLQEVWDGRIVSDAALTTRINAVRRAIGDDGTAQRLVRTFTRKGIRFIGKVTELPDPATPATIRMTNPVPLPDKPSIAVMPFANLSDDPSQDYFADGMVEEIITALSRIRWLFVIARNSSFAYKGQATDAKRVGRELGVRYVLEGSVRKSGDRVRITAQLIEAETGAHLLADRFDGSLEDIFELQDKIAFNVAGIIEPTLQAAEMLRSATRPTRDLTAYDLYLRALAVFFPVTKDRVIEALGFLEQALAIDDRYGPALAWAATCHLRLVRDGWSEEPDTDQRKAVDFARRALQAARNDPRVLANTALVLARFGEDVGAMIGLIDRALALNPSFARGWYHSGVLRIAAGEPDLAMEHIKTALRLSPREQFGTPLAHMGQVYFFKHRFEEAEATLLQAIQDNPGSPEAYRFLAACYAHMGRIDDARAIVARLSAITSLIMPRVLYYRNPEYRDLFLSGLRLALGEAE